MSADRVPNSQSVRGPLGKLLVVGLIGVLTFSLIYSTLRNTVPGETHTYYAQFNDVTGLREGDDVRVAGVKVGRVDGLELDGADAEVSFTVQADQPLFANTRALIRYQNLVGQRYLALMPGAGPARPLADGDRIPQERTEPSLDLSALLNGFEPLFSMLQPKDLNRLSGTIVQTLQGQAPALRSLLSQSATLTTEVAERDEVLGKLLTGLTGVLDHLSGKSAEFDRLLTQSKQLVNNADRHSDEIFGTMERITGVAGNIIGLMKDIRPGIRDNIVKFNNVGDMFLEDRQAVEQTVRGLPGFLGGLAKISNYGSWLNLYACNIVIAIEPLPRIDLNSIFGTKHTEVCR